MNTNALHTHPLGMPHGAKPVGELQFGDLLKSKSASCNTSMPEEWCCISRPMIAPDSIWALLFNNVGIAMEPTTTARHRGEDGTDTGGFEQKWLLVVVVKAAVVLVVAAVVLVVAVE